MTTDDNQDYQEKLTLYEALVDTHTKIERKGKSNPYTSVNGHMFSYLSKVGELGLRLSAEDREAFVEKYKSEPFVQYGAVMKEYVAVPDGLLAKTEELEGYLVMSYDYVSALKPKPTKMKKKK